MKKENLIFIVLIFLVFFIAIYFLLNNGNGNSKVCIKENCFIVELALTENEKSKGLMFQKSLDKNKGMLFIYDKEGVYNFWMKNTLISLDIIWIDSDKQIVYIEHNAKPCGEVCNSLSPSKNSRYVLEVNGGTMEELNITIGDFIEFYDIK